MIDEEENDFDQKKSVEDFQKKQKQSEYYVDEIDQQYWSSKCDEKDEKDEFKIFHVAFENQICCRHCKNIFQFNNQLYDHLSNTHDIKQKNQLNIKRSRKVSSENLKSFAIIDASMYIIIKFDEKSFVIVQKSFANEASKFFANEISKSFAEEMFNIVVIKNNFVNVVNISMSLFIIKFSMNFDFEVDTDYDFQNWTYVKINISFSEKTSSEKSCLDIDAGFALINRKFFETQAFDVFIRIMITFITIRDLDIDKHIISEYVIIFMIFTKENDQENDVRVMFRREIHIMNNLKINILMKNEIMNFEKISIDFEKNTARINSCSVIVSIEVHSFNKAMFKSIHLRKTITIFLRSKISISVHHFDVSNRNFLFEFDEILYITVYAYIINIIINAMILRNDFNKLI